MQREGRWDPFASVLTRQNRTATNELPAQRLEADAVRALVENRHSLDFNPKLNTSSYVNVSFQEHACGGHPPEPLTPSLLGCDAKTRLKLPIRGTRPGVVGGIKYRIPGWTSRDDLYGLIRIVSLNHAAPRAHDVCSESAESA